MKGSLHIAYMIAIFVAILAYVVLLIFFHIICYCMRKCPSLLTGSQPQRRDVEANQQTLNQMAQQGRKVYIMNARDFMSQSQILPNREIIVLQSNPTGMMPLNQTRGGVLPIAPPANF